MNSRLRAVVARVLAAAVALAAVVVPTSLATATSATATVSTQSQERQLWVWWVGAPGEAGFDPQAVVARAKANHITRLLVHVPDGSSTDPERIATFTELRTRASKAGLHLDALSGENSWCDPDSPGGLADARRWAKEVKALGVFERVHVDSEPVDLPAWSTAEGKVAAGLRLLQAYDTVRSASGLPVDADIPHWFWEIEMPSGRALDAEVLRHVDSVTLMAYQRTAARIEGVAARTMRTAAAAKKPAYIGIEIADTGVANRDWTLYGLSAAKVSAIIGQVERESRAVPGYAGTAIHYDAALAALGGTIAPTATASQDLRVSLTAPARLTYGTRATFSGTVTDPRHPGAPQPGLVVSLYRTTSKGSVRVASTTTNASGAFRFRTRITATGRYHAVRGTAASRTARVTAAATVTLTAPTSVARGKAATFTGAVARPGRQRVTLERRVQKTWRTYATVTTSSSGTFRFVVDLPRGTSTYRVSSRATATVAGAHSRTRTVTQR